MKKVLFLSSALLIAGALTTFLWMGNSRSSNDLLSANVEALTYGESPVGWPGQQLVRTESAGNARCDQPGVLYLGNYLHIFPVYINGPFEVGRYYSVSYSIKMCMSGYEDYCDSNQQGFSLIQIRP